MAAMFAFKLTLGLLFACLVTGILVLGVISYNNNEASSETAKWVDHSRTVLDKTQAIVSIHKDIQLESNAIFTKYDPLAIKPYKESRDGLVPMLFELQYLVDDNPVKRQSVDSLILYTTRLIAVNDSILALPQTDYSLEQIQQRIDLNRDFREKIHYLTISLQNNEHMLLKQRQVTHQQALAAFNRAFYGLLVLIAVLLLTTFFAIRFTFNKRIRMQEELKKANDLFAKLFYESPTGFVISRRNDGIIIDCNRAYCDLVNYTKQELIGNTLVALNIVPEAFYRDEILSSSIASGPAQEIELQMNRKHQRPLSVSILVQPLQIGDEACLLCATVDMTTHKAAEAKIQSALTAEIELNKLKSNFVTLASHEFRTPLTTILSSAFLLENYVSGPASEKVAKHVSRIKNATKSLTSILDEFLSLSKIEEGKIEPQTDVINLPELLEELCRNFRSFARNGQVITYHHEGEPMVYSDPVFISNIVNNMVSNAIKYSGENTTIEVSSSLNGKLRLDVKDQGIGISPEDQAHLFERFFRASNSGNVQGTGLGLHILKHYVDMLHGTIEVDSNPGQGSRFSVILPPQPKHN